jgi:hypothetical protein
MRRTRRPKGSVDEREALLKMLREEMQGAKATMKNKNQVRITRSPHHSGVTLKGHPLAVMAKGFIMASLTIEVKQREKKGEKI